MHVLEQVQRLPIPIEEAWDFFSTPANLNAITPPDMHFHIRSKPEWVEKMYAGQLILYTVRPLWNIPFFWMTEITQVKEGAYFIDEQRFGPFAFWHHQHHFRAIPGGVEMIDLLHYKVPLGMLGRLINLLLVGDRVRMIFNYRRGVLEKRFGTLDAL